MVNTHAWDGFLVEAVNISNGKITSRRATLKMAEQSSHLNVAGILDLTRLQTLPGNVRIARVLHSAPRSCQSNVEMKLTNKLNGKTTRILSGDRRYKPSVGRRAKVKSHRSL